jgi:hypothetical protein
MMARSGALLAESAYFLAFCRLVLIMDLHNTNMLSGQKGRVRDANNWLDVGREGSRARFSQGLPEDALSQPACAVELCGPP